MATSLSDEEIERRVSAAQKIQLNLDEATGPHISRFVTDYASSIGSPKEFFLLPLQSIAAYFMGPKTTVKVHEGWSEPVIVWEIVMVHKGQKESPALGCFHKELCKMEEDMISCNNESEEKQPQIFVEHFSFDELHYTMKKNNGRIIGLYDELSLLYEQLDRYKSGQADRKTILTLINGGCWRRNFRSNSSTMRSTCFNLTGFVHPATVIRLCNDRDDDGLMDRQFFACPGEVHYDYDEYQHIPPTTPSLFTIFKVIDENHPPGTTYTLTNDARMEFIALHDGLNQRIRQEHPRDHDRKSILSKGHGQLLRLAAIQHCLDQALCTIENGTETESDTVWNYAIPKDALLKAAVLLDYFIAQKFAIGSPPRDNTTGVNHEDMGYDWHRLRPVLELPHGIITPSMISQAHIQKRVGGRYSRDAAVKLMEDIQSLQLGTVAESSGTGRPTKLLRKRKLEELNEDTLDILTKKMKVDKNKYILS